MKKYLKTKIFLLFLFTLLFSCSAQKLSTIDIKVLNVQGELIPIKVEIAKTDTEKSFGFMNRKHIPDDTGMIFVYEKDQRLSFWMKNTPTPLSLAYIDKTGVIRDIFDMEPYSLKDITSTVSVRYALEVPQGWFEKKNIKIGCKLILD